MTVEGIRQRGAGVASADAAHLNRDTLMVAHELGHNFGSDHTHCYGNLEGNENPVDGCAVGSREARWRNTCFSGTQSLPGVNSLTGGTPGAQNGTIMSYCHLLEGNIYNTKRPLAQTRILVSAPACADQNGSPNRCSRRCVAPVSLIDHH